MFDDDLIRKANIEIARLNRELAAIHEDEERCAQHGAPLPYCRGSDDAAGLGVGV